MSTHRSLLSLLIASTATFAGCSDDSEDACAGRSNVYAGSIAVTSMSTARLSDLACAEVITGDLSLHGLPEESLEPLAKLVHVFGDVAISDSEVKSLHGLERLEEVGGDLSISSSTKLSSVKALKALKSVGGSLSLDELPNIENFAGLESLEAVGGDLSITRNDQLTDLHAFESLRRIEGKFTLDSNAQLTSATFGSGEAFLAPKIGSMIFIAYNDALKELSGFGAPKGHDAPCTILDSDVVVFMNANLEKLVLPGGPTRVCHSVSSNPNLATISGGSELDDHGRGDLELLELPSLTSVSFSMWQFDNLWIQATGLESLDGFALCPVRCDLQLSKNPVLTDISFRQQSVGPYAAQFYVTDNPALPTCRVLSVLDALPAPNEICVRGSELAYGSRDVEVSGNDGTATCQ